MLIGEKNPHGGDIWNRECMEGVTAGGKLLDFSANGNPYGMPDSVRNAVLSALENGECGYYPDTHCTELRRKISEYEGVPEDSILCGNGASELIYSFAYTLPAVRSALIVSPTFSEYESALAAAGVSVRHFVLREPDFRLSDGILDEIDGRDGAVFLCSPNNPTGITVDYGLLCRIAEKCGEMEEVQSMEKVHSMEKGPSRGVRLFCDFCFLDMTDAQDYHVSDFVKKYPQVFVLKAFTKSFGMAGLRLGYALCSDRDFLQDVARKAPCWNVSQLAQRAGAAAMGEKGYVEDCRRKIKAERERMILRLEKMGITVYPGEANYLLLRSSVPLYELLLRCGILTRSCANYRSLDQRYIRVAVKTPEENDILLGKMEEIMMSEEVRNKR